MLKRSLTLAGHRTSLALEAEYWDALEEIARIQNITVPALISRIDAERTTQNMSSAVRLAVLAFYRGQSGGNNIKS